MVLSTKATDEDGVLVRYFVFLKCAKKYGYFNGVGFGTLNSIVMIRNELAHSFKRANRPLSMVLEKVSATDCAKLFKNAFSSVNMDAEARFICNELLYDLFRRDGLQLSDEFEKWISVENDILREEIKNANKA